MTGCADSLRMSRWRSSDGMMWCTWRTWISIMVSVSMGVAALHTEILKKSELNCFYRLYPEKFNNKTNGITFRRWLLHCNPLLAGQISQWIGDGYRKDAMELKKLEAFAGMRMSFGACSGSKRKIKRDWRRI